MIVNEAKRIRNELNELEFFYINQYKENCYNTKFEIGKCGGDTLTNNKQLKDIKIKVTNKGKETIISLDDKRLKLSGFNFDNLGEYSGVVLYNNKTYSFK